MAPTTARGIRNRNPGNLRYSAGLAQLQGLDTPAADADGYCRFTSDAYGIRAIAVILITYRDKRKARDGSRIDTVREIIERWAPAADHNDEEAYAAHLSRLLKVKPGDVLELHRYDVLRPLVEGIIRHENGSQPYPDAVIEKGLRLAGVEPPAEPSLQKSRTVRGAQVAAAGTVLSVATQAAQTVAPFTGLLETMACYAPYALGALVLAGIAWIVWARIDDRRRGLR
jgi:hypothetical protein